MTQLARRERPSHHDQRPKRILNLDETRALLAHTSNSDYRVLLMLLLASGLRIGEALGLTVADLEPDNSIIRISHQLGRDGIRAPVKTPASQRAVDLPLGLMQQILVMLDRRGTRLIPTAFVFASRSGTAMQRKVVREALKRAAIGAQLAPPLPTLHDLRHSHASMLIAFNTNIVDIQHRLGHTKPDTTLRAYAHEWRYQEARRSVIGERLDSLLLGEPTADSGEVHGAEHEVA